MAASQGYLFIITLAVAAIAYFYLDHKWQVRHLETILDGLQKEERNGNSSKPIRVAVGFGACMDIFVDGLAVIKKVNVAPPKIPLHHDVINSISDLAETFAYFMKEGAASEKFTDPQVFEKILKVAESVPGRRWAPGGNAPVISRRLSIEGAEELLVASNASAKYRDFFPKNVNFLGESDHQDDIHIVLEFKAGDVWGNYTAARANRFIIHSDTNNPKLRYIESFKKRIADFNPDLVIVSALQMLDNFPFEGDERERRMEVLQDLLKTIPFPVHFEMASFTEKVMLQALLKYVIPYASSLGMNEQELPNLVSMFKYNEVVNLADASPRTAIILDLMRELYTVLKEKSVSGIERIHLHTLAFQAVLTKRNTRWKNTRAAISKASLVANKYVCNTNEVDIRKSKLLMDESFAISTKPGSRRIFFTPEKPVSCWGEDDYEICVAPVLVCTHIYQTGGAGDNISPSGFILQL